MAEKDIMEKTLESFNDVFSDIVNVLLFNGVEEVKADELKQAFPRSFYKADGKLREQERDTAKYWNRTNLRISLLGLENETSAEDDVPLRIMGYDGAAYRNQLYFVKDENGKRHVNRDPRYPVITLVLYFGSEHWNKPVSLHDSLSIPEKLIPFVSDYRINLFEIAWLTDAQLSKFKSDFRVVADYFVQIRKNGEYIPTQQQIVHVREVMHMMSVLTNDNRFEQAYEQWEKGDEPKTMSDALDRLIQKGEAKGRAEGRAEGKAEGKAEGMRDAIRSLMRTMGWSIEQAMSALQIPDSEKQMYANLTNSK